MRTLLSRSVAETERIAARLGALLGPGDVVGLVGELGAGKTAFVRGLARGLGIPPRTVTSPTFTIIDEHRGGRLPLHHVDLYRLADARELGELGLEEILGGEGASAVEWIDRFPEVAPADWLEVRLAFTKGAAGPRRIEALAHGPRAQAAASAWLGERARMRSAPTSRARRRH